MSKIIFCSLIFDKSLPDEKFWVEINTQVNYLIKDILFKLNNNDISSSFI